MHELAEAVDLYFANRWQHNDRRRAGALGVPSSTKPVGSSGSVNRSVYVTTPKSAGSPSDNRSVFNARSAPGSGEPTRRCFPCGSKSHLKNECPERNKSNATRSNAKVSTCQVHEQQKFGRHIPVVCTKITQTTEVKDAEVQACEPGSFDDYLTDDIARVQSVC